VTPEECRERARDCRFNAVRSWGKLQADFLAAAETWEMVAEHLERQAAVRVVITKKTASDPTEA